MRYLLAPAVLWVALAGCSASASSPPGHADRSAASFQLAKVHRVARRARHCFENPEYEGTARIEACGYPGPHSVGYETGGRHCSELREYTGSSEPATGARIERRLIRHPLTIENSDVTLDHDCVIVGGAIGGVTLDECSARDFRIENSDVRGEGPITGALENAALADDCNPSGGKLGFARRDSLEFCGGCIHGNWEVVESYANANPYMTDGNSKGIHREPVYIYSSDGTPGIFIAADDTLLNGDRQTAVVFADTYDHGQPCLDRVQISDSFLAGSGQVVQMCGGEKSSAWGSARLLFERNRLARCRRAGGTFEGLCTDTPRAWRASLPGGEEEKAKALIYGDRSGYFPNSGWRGAVALGPGCAPVCPERTPSFLWRGNYWDDNLRAAPTRE